MWIHPYPSLSLCGRYLESTRDKVEIILQWIQRSIVQNLKFSFTCIYFCAWFLPNLFINADCLLVS